MTPTQLIGLIQQNEGQQIEFKLESEKQGDLAEVLMRTPVRDATLDDLNEQRVKEFLVKRLRTSIPDQSLQQLLLTLHAAVKDEAAVLRPTVAGLLFFADWPQLHLNHATILAARLVGARGVQISDRATIEGPIPEVIDRAIQFVQRNTRHGLQIGDPLTGRAREIDEYPGAAVREAIINACCHRDYLERAAIQLKIYDDRLVIANPGGLLPGLSVAHLEGIHKARNPLLADWLHVLGYVERFGIGILRMREAMEQAGLPTPRFASRPDWFEVTLHGPGAHSTVAQSENVAPADSLRSNSAGSAARTHQSWYTQVWSFR